MNVKKVYFYVLLKMKNGIIILWNINMKNKNWKKIFEKEKAHDGYIYSWVELKDGTIVSGRDGDGYSIKLWKD